MYIKTSTFLKYCLPFHLSVSWEQGSLIHISSIRWLPCSRIQNKFVDVVNQVHLTSYILYYSFHGGVSGSQMKESSITYPGRAWPYCILPKPSSLWAAPQQDTHFRSLQVSLYVSSKPYITLNAIKQDIHWTDVYISLLESGPAFLNFTQ